MPRIPAGALLSVNAYKIMFISCRGDQASAQGYFQGCGKLCARDANRGKQALKSLVCSNGQTTDTSEVWLWKAFALRKTTARQCPGAAPGQAWGCSSCLATAGDTWPGGTVPAVTQGDTAGLCQGWWSREQLSQKPSQKSSVGGILHVSLRCGQAFRS